LRELAERDLLLLEELRDLAAVPLDPFRDLALVDRLDPLRDFVLLPLFALLLFARDDPLDDDFRWVLGAVLPDDERSLA
jgi:hypothetical protein